MANTLSPRLRVHGNPVQVEGSLGQWMRSKAGVAQRTPPIFIHQKDVATGFALSQVSIPQFLDAGYFVWLEDASGGR